MGISPLMLGGALLIGVVTGSLVTMALRGPSDGTGVSARGDEPGAVIPSAEAVRIPQETDEVTATNVGGSQPSDEVEVGVVVPPRAEELDTVPAWQRYALATPVTDGRPMIALVIDDVGIDRRRSLQAIELPAPLTISFIAYANDLPAQAMGARTAGHELLVHVPMGPHNPDADPGPGALLLDLSVPELESRLEAALSQFSGYVGINNHMGSRFTESEDRMKTVMSVLRSRGLLFLDSRTSSDSVGFETAQDLNVPSVTRDVFLDHDPTPDAVRAALVELEDIARKKGYAVGIGHPKDATLEVLQEWIPLAADRGFVLVPISAVVSARAGSG